MNAAYRIHMAKVRLLEAQGWHIADLYPIAGITIMVRDEQRITVLKSGEVIVGNHPPRS